MLLNSLRKSETRFDWFDVFLVDFMSDYKQWLCLIQMLVVEVDTFRTTTLHVEEAKPDPTRPNPIRPDPIFWKVKLTRTRMTRICVTARNQTGQNSTRLEPDWPENPWRSEIKRPVKTQSPIRPEPEMTRKIIRPDPTRPGRLNQKILITLNLILFEIWWPKILIIIGINDLNLK